MSSQMMDLALLLSLVFVFMSSYADAEDICGIPIIKPIFNYTLNGDILSDVMQDGEAEPHSFPWMASIHVDTQFWCGGSIVGNKWILTSAHCVSMLRVAEYKYLITITVGSNNISLPRNDTLTYDVSRYYEPGYKRNILNKDIALVELTRELTFSDHVQPICLPEQDDSSDPQLMTIGWGDTHATDNNHVLRQTRLCPLSSAECNGTTFARLGNMHNSMRCARRPRRESGVCYFDAGGPLISNDSEFNVRNSTGSKPWVLYGITASDTLCRTTGMFTKVSHFVDWIKTITNDNLMKKK